jgi:uncharacterized protein YbjQ (UPF0145 family)
MTQLAVFLGLLAVGFFFGRVAERNHFASIVQREEQLRAIRTFTLRQPPPSATPPETALVGGNAVIAIDYFKRIAAILRSLVGGRIGAFETLVERARREAILRMQQEASDMGAHSIINVRLETASITKGSSNQTTCIEVYAYGTALIKAGSETNGTYLTPLQ